MLWMTDSKVWAASSLELTSWGADRYSLIETVIFGGGLRALERRFLTIHIHSHILLEFRCQVSLKCFLLFGISLWTNQGLDHCKSELVNGGSGLGLGICQCVMWHVMQECIWIQPATIISKWPGSHKLLCGKLLIESSSLPFFRVSSIPHNSAIWRSCRLRSVTDHSPCLPNKKAVLVLVWLWLVSLRTK